MNRVAQERSYDKDAAVIELARAGDVDAFGLLYDKYRTRIYNICLRMIKEPCLAEDMLQECFLCAFRRIPSFRGDSLFSTWLHRIAINAVLMHFRRCRTCPIEQVNPEPANEGGSLDGEQFHVEDSHLSLSVERIALERAINSLPPGYRIMFVLHDIEGFEHWEIAAFLGCTPGNTKSQLFKARRRLREIMLGRKKNSRSEKMAA